MRVSFKFSRRFTARILWSSALVASSLAGSSVLGRPIEFSEPTESNATSSVSSLGEKPASLLSLEDRGFKPYTYTLPRDQSFNMKPMRPAQSLSAPQKNSTPGTFDRDENWLQMAPDKMLLKMWERDTLKLPTTDSGNKLSDAGSSWDPFNTARRNDAAKNDSRNRIGNLNEPNNAADPMNLNDPLGKFAGRNTFPDTSSESPSDLLEQKQQADRLEDFKKSLNPQIPAMTPVLNTRLPAPVVNVYVSDPENLTHLQNGMPRPQFEIPKVPVAPQAPFAPGQNSLAPSIYTPPAKPKVTTVTAPRRSF